MRPTVEVRRNEAYGWGQTSISAKFSEDDSAYLQLPGVADVYTNEFAVVAMWRGASMNSVWYLIGITPTVVNPITQTGILGITVLDRKGAQHTFRPKSTECLTLNLGPVDLAIDGDTGGVISETHRMPLTSVRSVIAETPVPIGLATLHRNPQSSRILLPAA